MEPDLTVQLGPLRLTNPVMPASGTFGFGLEYASLVDLRQLGALVVKSVTLHPTRGNPPPRLCETPAGILNAIGLMNPGVEVFIRDKMPLLEPLGVPIIVNIAGRAQAEYAELAARLDGVPGVSALEVNISCPNVKEGGMAFGADPQTAALVTRSVRQATRLPIIVKLSPNVTDISVIARAVEAEGADALSLINTLTGLVIDVEKRRPVLGNTTGGLAGPAIRPVAVHLVWRVARAVRLPIIGMGGITSASDALQFILAGASAVAVGTQNFVQPKAMLEVLEGIKEYMIRHGVARVQDIVGQLQV